MLITNNLLSLINQLRMIRSFSQSSIQLKKKRKLLLVPPLNESDLIEQFVRGSGPGGQAVNKTNNAVSLIHQPTGIRVQAHTHRSRESNRNQARRVLAERVDYFLNRGKSQIEKEWKREQRRKIKKIKKRQKKEKEELEEKNLNINNNNIGNINERLGPRQYIFDRSKNQVKRKKFNSIDKKINSSLNKSIKSPNSSPFNSKGNIMHNHQVKNNLNLIKTNSHSEMKSNHDFKKMSNLNNKINHSSILSTILKNKNK